jgi:hypothetical protein
MFSPISTCESKWVYSFIALQIPKTASSSIAKCCGSRNLIQKHRGLFQETFGRNPLYKGVFDVRHVIPEHIFSLIGRQVYDYFSFAIVRNPFHRIESAYLFGRKIKLHGVYGLPEDCSFEQFVDFLYESWEANRQDVLILKPQTTWTHSAVFRPTEILKLEELEKSWPQMLKTYGIRGLPPLTRENVTDRSQSLPWNKASRSKVIEMFESEFDLLGYSRTFV